MSKCSNCRKAEALDTWSYRFARWIVQRLFPIQVNDIVGERYTQGFSDGYVMGMKHAKENSKQNL